MTRACNIEERVLNYVSWNNHVSDILQQRFPEGIFLMCTESWGFGRPREFAKACLSQTNAHAQEEAGDWPESTSGQSSEIESAEDESGT